MICSQFGCDTDYCCVPVDGVMQDCCTPSDECGGANDLRGQTISCGGVTCSVGLGDLVATDDGASATDDGASATDDGASATDDGASATDDGASATDDAGADDSCMALGVIAIDGLTTADTCCTELNTAAGVITSGGDMASLLSAEACDNATPCGAGYTYAVGAAAAAGLVSADIPAMWAGGCAALSSGGGDDNVPTPEEAFCAAVAGDAVAAVTDECAKAPDGLLTGPACMGAALGNMDLVNGEVATLCSGGATDDAGADDSCMALGVIAIDGLTTADTCCTELNTAAGVITSGGDMASLLSAEACDNATPCGAGYTYAVGAAAAAGLVSADIPAMWAGGCAALNGGGATDDAPGFLMTPRDDFVQCAIDGGLDVPSLSAPVHCCIELLMANELPATCLGTDDEGFCLPADGTCPFAPPDMPLPGLVFTTSNCQMLLGMDATAQEMVAFCGVTDLVELCNAMPLFMGPNACWDGLCTTYCDGTGGCP